MAAHEHLLRIRPGMDVYNTYQNQYIGSVVKVWRQPQPHPTPTERGATARQTGSAPETLAGTPELVHEEGAATSPVSRSGDVSNPEARLGEEMGPFPTIAVGNTGPIKQSSAHHYATGDTGPPADVVCFAVRPGRINLGILTPPLYVPTSAVRSVSMERVILDVPGNEIPPAWRRRPTS